MPAVAITALGTVVGGSLAGVAGAKLVALVLLNMALTGASMLLSKTNQLSSDISGLTISGYGAAEPRQIIYGEAKVGGTYVFQHATGDSNEYLHCILVFAGHQIESFEKIWFGDYELLGNGASALTISNSNVVSCTRILYVVIITTSVAHGLSAGDYIDLSGATPSEYNDSFKVIDVISSTQIKCVPASSIDIDSLASHTTVQPTISRITQFTGTNEDDETKDFSGYAWIYEHLGADDQEADSALISAAPDYWTSDHRLRGCAYLYIKLKYNSDLFSGGLPNVSALIKGKNTIYDPRTETSGWSENPALCLADYVMSKIGLQFESDEIDWDAFIEAANICDEEITNADGETQSRYTCNGATNTSVSPDNIISSIRQAMGGVFYPNEGLVSCRAGAWATPESEGLTKEDIIGGVSIQSSLPREDTFNCVKGTYVSPENDYEEADFPSIASDTYIDQDGGTEMWLDITMAFVNNANQAQRIAKIELLKARQPITVAFKAPWKAVKFAIGDIIPVSLDRYGWDEKYFEVQAMELGPENDENGYPTLVVDLTLRETDSSIYDWSTDEESSVDPAPNTNLPSPYGVLPPTDLTLSSGTSELFVRADGTIWSRIRCDWVVSAWSSVVNGGHYLVQYKRSSASEWSTACTPSGNQNYCYIPDVEDGVKYDVRVYGVSSIGIQSKESAESSNHTVVGKTEPPAAPTSFLARRLADGTRKFTWTDPSDLDLAGVEIRYSTTTSDTWDDMIPLHTGVLTSSPYETNNPSPAATYLFAIKSIDRSKNYSTEVAYITTAIGAGRIAGVIASYDEREDGWTGTLTDCHVESDNGDIEADGGLTWDDLGSWDSLGAWRDGATSPITYETAAIDLGASYTFIPIIEGVVVGTTTYEINTSADGSTWAGWTSTLGSMTARYIKVRVSVSGDSPIIKSLTITINQD